MERAAETADLAGQAGRQICDDGLPRSQSQPRGVFEVDEDAAVAELGRAWADGGYHQGAMMTAPARPVPASGHAVVCGFCQLPDPSPDIPCLWAHDHDVGTHAGCAGCGRLKAVCTGWRACSARRSRLGWRLGWLRLRGHGDGCGHGQARRAAARLGGARGYDVRTGYLHAEHGADL